MKIDMFNVFVFLCFLLTVYGDYVVIRDNFFESPPSKEQKYIEEMELAIKNGTATKIEISEYVGYKTWVREMNKIDNSTFPNGKNKYFKDSVTGKCYAWYGMGAVEISCDNLP